MPAPHDPSMRLPTSRGRLAGRTLGSRTLALLVALCATSAAALGAPRASAAPPRPSFAESSSSAEDARALGLLAGLIPTRYASAQPRHDVALAARVRGVATTLREHLGPLRAARDPRYTTVSAELARLETMLDATRQRFEPWPLVLELDAATAAVERELGVRRPQARQASTSAYAQIEAALARAQRLARAENPQGASIALFDAYALYARGPGERLAGIDAPLDGKLERELLTADSATTSRVRELASAAEAARADLRLAAQALGEVHVSRATIVVNGAILVFREGLEAVLILAAITASFAGARRRLRKPVLVGAFAGLIATILTWVVAQLILHALGDGGLRLQAITGMVAIGVLLLVTNWFFHRVYWSEWIARFNRRRKTLERIGGTGFLSGQAAGLILLGLSSVYREGLETVLFLQALQTSAGTGATALGAGIGLTATLLVATATFKLQRKLPFKRMLILTGILIALVLAVMAGTTIHNVQAIGWLPTTPTSFTMSAAWSTWLGAYPTWEGIVGQVASLAFVFGSYFVARELQLNRRWRHTHARRPQEPLTSGAARAAGP